MQRADPQIADATPHCGAIRRILVVDDSRLQRRILTRSLRRWGFDVIEAESALAALAICRKGLPDLVLSDWMMPGMTGLEFCRAFRALERADYGYFILLTSKNEKEEIARGLDNGADDFLTKPVNPHELRARINAGGRIVSMQRELSRNMAEIRSLYDAIEKDLIQARTIQQLQVPVRHRDFGAAEVSLLLRPCGHVGGDLVGMFSPGGGGAVGFYCIDVSGHGITSALMTARVSGYLGGDFPEQNIAMARQGERFALRPPEEVASLLNQRLSVDAGVAEYFTMVYGTADLTSGRVRLVQAGHPHPVVLRADGACEFAGPRGLPIGLVPGAVYEGFDVDLAAGDGLLLYSDGITEARVKDGGMLGPEGLVDLLGTLDAPGSGTEFLDDLFWRLTESMRPGAAMEDDVSAALLRLKPP